MRIKLLKRLNEKHRVVMWEWYNKTFKIYYKDCGDVIICGEYYQSEIEHYCKAHELYHANVCLRRWNRIGIRVAIEKVNDMLDIACGHPVEPRRGWKETENKVLSEHRKSLSLALQQWAKEREEERIESELKLPKLRSYTSRRR